MSEQHVQGSDRGDARAPSAVLRGRLVAGAGPEHCLVNVVEYRSVQVCRRAAQWNVHVHMRTRAALHTCQCMTSSHAAFSLLCMCHAWRERLHACLGALLWRAR